MTEFEMETVEVEEGDRLLTDIELAEPATYIEASLSNLSTDSMVSCRICKGCRGHDLVPSPCNCKGSMGTVHVTCLEEWLTGSTRDSCELCAAPFNVVRTRKYSFFTSAYLFLRQHTNGLKLLRDLFFLAVSVMNTIILLFMWVNYVFRDFLKISGSQPMIEKSATSPLKGALYLFFFTMCLVFVVVNTMDDFRRVFYFYCLPWYHWWQSAVDVKLVNGEAGTDKSKTQ